jgi:hypothetical protein
MQNAGSMSAQVAERVRDANFNGATQPQVINLLSYSQQVINGILGDVTGTASLLVQPRSTLYQISAFLPACVKIQAVRDAGGRDLEPMPFEALSWLDMKWVVSIADSPRGYAIAGRDVLVIYPGLKVAQPLTVVYTALTAPLATKADSTVVPNETDHAIYDLTEVLLLLKNRDMAGCKTVMDRLSGRIKELQGGRR